MTGNEGEKGAVIMTQEVQMGMSHPLDNETHANDGLVPLWAWRHRLHQATVAILTPSRDHWEYQRVEHALASRVPSLSPIVFAVKPANIPMAHDLLAQDLQRYTVWLLVQDVGYPAWVVATLLQVHSIQPQTRVFSMGGYPLVMHNFVMP